MRHIRTPAALDALILLLTLAGLGAIAFTGNYAHFIIGLVAITAILCTGLNVLYGLTGLISLGQVGFFAIGAYACAVLTLNGVSFWIALPLAAIIAGAVGCLLAIPAMRMEGPFLAMITIAFAFIVEHAAIEWRDVTGGQNGLMGFPMPQIGGYVFAERDLVILAVSLCGVSLLAFRRLKDGGWGYAMAALRDADIAAQSLGYRPFVIKSLAFAVAAAMAGLAGALYAPLMMFIAPSNFPFSQSILFLFAVIVGGAGTVLGPLIGALVTVLLPEMLSGLAEHRLLFFGALLVAVLLLAPRGIVGTLSRLLPRSAQSTDAMPAEAVQHWIEAYPKPSGLRVERIGIAFGGVRAVKEISLTARSGQVTSIIGPNGAGKTTVLNIVSGFYRPDQGAIHAGDSGNLAGMPAEAISRHGIARTYQTTRLFETISVVDNVIAGLPNGRLGSPFPAMASKGNRALALGLLRYCGFAGDPDKRAGDLPHVDRRLVEIARSLATQPGILLLDEPAAGLMQGDKDKLAMLIRRLADTGIATILVEHDMDLVMEISDVLLAMDAGEPIAFGTPAEIRSNPKVIAAYLGDGTTRVKPRRQTFQAAQTPVLETVGLTAGYGGAPVLRSVSIKVRKGEMVTLLGANGAGKSTFLAALSGLLRPVEGNIVLNDALIQAQPSHAIVKQGLVLVPEGRQVFPQLTARENIELGAYKRQDAAVDREIEAILARFPRLRNRLDTPAGLLSGGEQQMMAIARGLLAQPNVILLDEPSLGLAPAIIEELYTILGELRDDGVTILLVDQIATLALALADYAYVLEQGRIVAEGTAADMARDERLIAAYLGGARGQETPSRQAEAS
jgi:branched-chain amino acid transport system ATP-binding protein